MVVVDILRMGVEIDFDRWIRLVALWKGCRSWIESVEMGIAVCGVEDAGDLQSTTSCAAILEDKGDSSF